MGASYSAIEAALDLWPSLSITWIDSLQMSSPFPSSTPATSPSSTTSPPLFGWFLDVVWPKLGLLERLGLARGDALHLRDGIVDGFLVLFQLDQKLHS